MDLSSAVSKIHKNSYPFTIRMYTRRDFITIAVDVRPIRLKKVELESPEQCRDHKLHLRISQLKPQTHARALAKGCHVPRQVPRAIRASGLVEPTLWPKGETIGENALVVVHGPRVRADGDAWWDGPCLVLERSLAGYPR